jgi:HEAT repeat protein
MSELGDALVAVLQHPQAEVRRRALLSATELWMRDLALRATVLNALTDPVWCVREAAAIAIGRVPDPDGDVLAHLLALTLGDPSPLVRVAAATAVAPRVVPERDYGGAVHHRFERQRARAATALGHITGEHTQEAARLLAVCIVDSHPKVRLAGLVALARLDPRALLPLVPLIVRKCAESDPRIARTARSAWSRAIESPEAEPLHPLRPYPGTNNLLGVRMTLEGLAQDHPLVRAAAGLLPVSGAETDAPRLARYLAAVCSRVLGLETDPADD